LKIDEQAVRPTIYFHHRNATGMAITARIEVDPTITSTNNESQSAPTSTQIQSV
jgi:hypothetical protein